jgi:integrase/recombinase XerD
MEQVFRQHQLCKLHGPLGPYFDSYASEMFSEGYARQTTEVQIRVVADFDRWLARHRLGVQEVTAELFEPFLRSRARRRHLTRCDVSALKRLMKLLVRERIVPEPSRPAATPVEGLLVEFGHYLQEERALSSRTQFCYLIFGPRVSQGAIR